MDENLFYVRTVFLPLAALLAMTASIIKLRGAAASILTALGFFLLAGVWGMHSLMAHEVIDPWDVGETLFHAMRYGELVGWALIVIGLFVTRRARPLGTSQVREPGLAPDSWHPAEPTTAAHFTDHEEAVPRPGSGLMTGWIVCSAIGFLLGLVYLGMYLDAGPRISRRELREMMPVLGLCLLTGIPAAILYCMWLYQSWSAVPARFRSTTPGKAVGFLFIPFFNLYWVFRAVPGLSKSIARAQRALAPDRATSAGYGVGLAAAIVSLVPYIGIASWILFLIWVILANGAKNQLLRQRRNAPRQPEAGSDQPY